MNMSYFKGVQMETSIQPHNQDLEDSLLGCLVENPEQYYKVESYLKNKDVWYIAINKRLWNIMSKMHDQREDIDIHTIGSNLTKNDNKNGMDFFWLTGLVQNAGIPSKSVTYAKKIYEDYLFRKTIEVSKKIQKQAYDGNSSVYPLINDTYTLLGEILDLRPSVGFDMGECIDKAMTEIKEGSGNMIKSGWRKIDKLSGGFTKGEISIIGGRPGHGKTTFLINLASKLVNSGYRVILFNRELPVTEVVKKFICLESGKLSYKMVRNSQFGQSDFPELEKMDKLLRKLYSHDRFQMFDQVRNFESAAMEIRKFKPDVVIDDYIQLIEPPKNVSERRLQLEKICNDYKWLAKTQSCVVVLASQLNRQIEFRGTRSQEPQLSDLAESGAIEQVAENVFFTHYAWKMHPDKKTNDPHKIKLIAKKVRYGETGSILLGYEGDKCKIYGSYADYEGKAN